MEEEKSSLLCSSGGLEGVLSRCPEKPPACREQRPWVNRKRQKSIFIWCCLYFPLFQWKMSLDSTKLRSEQQIYTEAVPRPSFLSGGLDPVPLCGDLGGWGLSGQEAGGLL